MTETSLDTTTDTKALAWSVSDTGMRSKLLRQDSKTGSKTMILQAPPRTLGPPKPHFHTADEEILNLGPAMQFDAGAKLERFGYAKYPAGLAHGAAIDLPDGYELLMRLSSRSTLHFDDVNRVPSLLTDHLYDFVPCPAQARWQRVHNLANHTETDVAELSWNETQHRGALFARMPKGASISFHDFCGSLELLVLEGAASLPGGKNIGQGTYVYRERASGVVIALENSLLFLHIS